MALVHPGKAPIKRERGGTHPSVCLLAGFAVIALAATAVHLLFSLI